MTLHTDAHISHAEARQIITAPAGRYLGSALSVGAVELLAAWAHVESGYGNNAAKNWGMLQAGSTWKGPTLAFEDSAPGSGKYVARYRAYSTHEEAAEDMVRLIATGYDGRAQAALASGSVEALAAALRIHRRSAGDPDDRFGYYEDAGPTPASREMARVRKLYVALIVAANELDPDRRWSRLPDGRPIPPTLRDGDRGRWVDVARKALHLDPGGAFPKGDVIQWQRRQGLHKVGKADGVFGPRCWAVPLAEGVL